MNIDYRFDSVALVIGNGFDISLGLDTRYCDFINYVNANINKEVHDSLNINKLYNYLNIKNETTWIDIEYELQKNAIDHIKEAENLIFYSPDSKRKIDNYPLIDKENYLEIRKYLKGYLKKIDDEFDAFDVDVNSSANRLIHDILKRDLLLQVINFNYTNTFKKMLDFCKGENRFNFKFNLKEYLQLYHVHGNVNQDIVFGIDDKVDIRKDYIYLLKSYDRNTSNKNFNTILNHSGKIIFFGYSLGVSDASYFEDFFISLCEHNNIDENKKRELVFYYKGEDDYTNLFYRLKELTKHNTAKLLRYNNVQFIDVDTYSTCFKAQEFFL